MNDQPSLPTSTKSHPFPMPDLDQVLSSVRADAANGTLSHWATSTVIDELTGVASISQDLFHRLHHAARIPATFPVGNAGLIHVYGYWFSTVLTPFGYKRDRWVDGELARAYGLPSTSFLREVSSAQTLLARVTDAALPLLHQPPSEALVAEAVVGRHLYRVVLSRRDDKGAYALTYGSTHAGPRSAREFQLITTFPYTGDPAEVCDEFAATPRLRWNAADRT